MKYRAGDILTACDNELNVPTGYLGHSAIVVDETRIVEAVLTYPYIQMSTAASFEAVHPKHALYRPVSERMGEAAARFAVGYYEQSNAYKAAGMNIPPFSFSQQVPLQDPWASVYCSKLVWLSYYYGAGYEFFNDFFLFSPEDLDAVLSTDPNFRLLYKHPEFVFLLDS